MPFKVVESFTALSLALRPGYYFLDGVAFEPEFVWTAYELGPPSFNLSANLAFNLQIPNSQIMPFVLGGYGFGNAVPAPVAQGSVVQVSPDFDVQNLNLGAGLKVFPANQFAVRIEYRYQRFDNPYENDSRFDRAVEYRHNILFGFSVFVF